MVQCIKIPCSETRMWSGATLYSRFGSHCYCFADLTRALFDFGHPTSIIPAIFCSFADCIHNLDNLNNGLLHFD